MSMCLIVDDSRMCACANCVLALLVLHLSLLLLPAYAPRALGAGRSSGDVPVRQHPNFPTQGKLLDGLPALLPKLVTCKARIRLGRLPSPWYWFWIVNSYRDQIPCITLIDAVSSYTNRGRLPGKVVECLLG